MNITIIGVGLIGGSLALALRSFHTNIIGVDNNSNHLQKALELGIIDQSMALDEAMPLSDLVLLAVPVDVARNLLPEVLDRINENCVVADMGSTKNGICSKIRKHPKRKQFVATHPIAGTENSGPEAAFSSLFKGKMTIICESELSSPEAMKLIQKMYKLLEMEIVSMKADEHDRHIAYVSHLSHITSFTLGLTVLEIEKDEKNIFNMAGSGFASTARLAKSSPKMWAPIFEQNAESLSEALDIYINNLQKFKNAIDNKDKKTAITLMTEANNIRHILDGLE